MNLTKTTWAGGWNPSSDAVNGDPNALLRMDNLRSDELGALTLVKGGQKLNPIDFIDYIYRIYSERIGAVEFIWVALNKTGRLVLRTNDDFSTIFETINGGGGKPCFCSFLDEVMICAGNSKVKDNGTRVLNLGVETTKIAPIITAINQDSIILTSGTYSLLEGHDPQFDDPSYLIFVDSTTLRGVIQMDYGSIDALNINGDPNPHGAADLFTILFQPHDTNLFTKFRVEFYVSDDGLDYYWFEWAVTESTFQLGVDQQTIASCNRSDFNRQGSNANADWTTVKKLRITGLAIADTWFLAGEQKFTGGAQGGINGAYTYIVVNVAVNSNYVGVSGISPESAVVNIFNGRAEITLPPVTDPQVTAQWLFRRSAESDITGFGLNLDQYYQVAVISPPGGSYEDVTVDTDALQLGITANLYLLSVADIPDFIVGMETFQTRVLYLTDKFILLSDPLNMDAIDTRYTVKAFGGEIERNLWIKRINNGALILATTNDLYQISGTLEAQPDGTLDINLVPIGEAYPPLCEHFAFTDGAIFYVSSVGVRVTTGSNSTNVSNPLNLIFNGETRYGIPGFFKDLDGDYPITVGKNKLYVGLELVDGTRRMVVYDMIIQQWRLEAIEPVALHTTPTERVLIGFGGGEGNFVRQWEVGNNYDGTVGIGCNLLTVFDANQQPRNRKDTFTLKLILDTGGSPVDVAIGKDGTVPTFLKTISSSGLSTQYIDLSDHSLGFRYALQITGNSLNTFSLKEYTIEYDPRPEQNVYLRIPSTNLGTQSRKRFIVFAFIIDTLGADVTFTPYVDGVAQPSSVVNKNGKLTYIHFFTSDTTGIDIGGILSGGNVFEFYEVSLSSSVSETIPPAAKFYLIPSNNYGTPNRKRFTSYKFNINTLGSDVVFTPRVDGINYSPFTFNTTEKRTVEYFFDPTIDIIGIDIAGMLSGINEFEFYGDVTPQQIEQFPPRLSSLFISPNDFGSKARKRHTSYKFDINTFGGTCTFTPILDGVQFPPLLFSTPSKQIIEYFFDPSQDITAREIGGILQMEPGHEFEFYGTITPEQVEVLPPRLESLYTPVTNFNVASRKRIRTIPLILDTRGGTVSFIPIIDDSIFPAQTFVTQRRTTVFYFFTVDAFPIDIRGVLRSLSGVPFEFYSYGDPEIVETLPVAKRLDQIGPVRYDKIAKLFELRIRIISVNPAPGPESIPLTIYGEDDNIIPAYSGNPLFIGTFSVVPFTDSVVTVKFPKSINSTVFRIVIGPTPFAFHRYDVQLRIAVSGMESTSKWITLK